MQQVGLPYAFGTMQISKIFVLPPPRPHLRFDVFLNDCFPTLLWLIQKHFWGVGCNCIGNVMQTLQADATQLMTPHKPGVTYGYQCYCQHLTAAKVKAKKEGAKNCVKDTEKSIWD